MYKARVAVLLRAAAGLNGEFLLLSYMSSLCCSGVHQDQEQLTHKSHTHQQTQTQQDTHRNTAPTLAHCLLPPYSPDINVTESLCHIIKCEARRNLAYEMFKKQYAVSDWVKKVREVVDNPIAQKREYQLYMALL